MGRGVTGRPVEVPVKEMARAIGLEYRKIPEWMNPRMAAEALGIKSRSWIDQQCRDGNIPCERVPLFDARVLIAGGKEKWATRIHKDDLIRWAFYRRTGPQPTTSRVLHLKRGEYNLRPERRAAA